MKKGPWKGTIAELFDIYNLSHGAEGYLVYFRRSSRSGEPHISLGDYHLILKFDVLLELDSFVNAVIRDEDLSIRRSERARLKGEMTSEIIDSGRATIYVHRGYAEVVRSAKDRSSEELQPA